MGRVAKKSWKGGKMNTQPKYVARAREEGRSITHDREIRDAVDRVYRKYGNDLSAFYRDVKKSITVEKSEADRPKKHGVSD